MSIMPTTRCPKCGIWHDSKEYEERIAELESRLKDYKLGNTVPVAIKDHIAELEEELAELEKENVMLKAMLKPHYSDWRIEKELAQHLEDIKCK